jgi:Fur family ferric uptake transcriptional regulator
MSSYNTEQKKMLLDFLERHHDSSYTIDEIVDGLKVAAGENAPGRSTVYRLMTRLVEERHVQRFAGEGSRRFLYRIIADDHCRNHLHLKCLGCGKILHLDRETSDALLKSVKEIKDFSISEEDTLLFGNCAACRTGEHNG